MDQTTSTICPWCSAEIPAGASACPNCRALVEGAKAIDIPGVTVVDPDAAQESDGGVGIVVNPISSLTVGTETAAEEPFEPEAFEREAIAPPTEEVRLEMRKIELEAEIENAGTDLMNPAGDETIPAPAPSAEAIAAHEAGLLDDVGPAGETDLAEKAEPWEDPELEARLSVWREQNSDKL
jgi:hypothetical protein